MPSSVWPRITIESLNASGAIIAHKDGNYGSLYPRVEDFGAEGVPFLTAKSLDAGAIDIAGAPRLADERADSLRFGFVQQNDVLLSHNATIGRVAVVPEVEHRLLVGTSLTYFRLNPQKLLPRYFAAYLTGADFQNQLAAVMSHSTRNQVPITAQRTLTVVVPPLEVQQIIAETLGALDDKIAQNRRTARALERLARATFKAWFIDFEPLKAKAAGQTSFPGMPPSAFAALPDRLTDSPFGLLPQGWGMGTMGDIAQQRREQVTPGEVDGETPYIGLDHMPRQDLTLSAWGAAASVTSSKFRFQRGDVLFGKLRPYFHKVGPAPVDGVCSTDIVVLHPKSPEYAAWLLMLVSGDDFVAHTDRSSAGTKMPRTNWKDMAAFPTALPPPPVAAAYQKLMGPMLDVIRAGIHESSRLSTLRDYLLPRLLSGRVGVQPSWAEVTS